MCTTGGAEKIIYKDNCRSILWHGNVDKWVSSEAKFSVVIWHRLSMFFEILCLVVFAVICIVSYATNNPEYFHFLLICLTSCLLSYISSMIYRKKLYSEYDYIYPLRQFDTLYVNDDSITIGYHYLRDDKCYKYRFVFDNIDRVSVHYFESDHIVGLYCIKGTICCENPDGTESTLDKIYVPDVFIEKLGSIFGDDVLCL